MPFIHLPTLYNQFIINKNSIKKNLFYPLFIQMHRTLQSYILRMIEMIATGSPLQAQEAEEESNGN